MDSFWYCVLLSSNINLQIWSGVMCVNFEVIVLYHQRRFEYAKSMRYGFDNREPCWFSSVISIKWNLSHVNKTHMSQQLYTDYPVVFTSLPTILCCIWEWGCKSTCAYINIQKWICMHSVPCIICINRHRSLHYSKKNEFARPTMCRIVRRASLTPYSCMCKTKTYIRSSMCVFQRVAELCLLFE